MNHLGRALLDYSDPPVQVLFVYNCNPVATVPDQHRIVRGLSRDDLFTVVFDQVMTDTALYADVVLPATTFLEAYDFAKSYGTISLELSRPVIEPVGESRSNADVFGELATRLDVLSPDEASGELDVMCRILDELPGTIGADLRQNRRPAPPFGTRPIQFVDTFPNTPGQKADLCPDSLDSASSIGLYRFIPDPGTERFPLALISPSSDKTISSTLGELPGAGGKLLMHPDDARARGLEDNDAVRVFNDLGEVHCTLRVLPTIKPGTVCLPKGLWRRTTRNGVTGTALVPDTLSDIAGGACFNDARVQVGSLASA
jgi:anaerobic selenocysteine-containing dehydrogenase